jgi:hypothetical protein
MDDAKRATPRVREHVDKLREAGLDTQKFFDVLCGIRDDSALPRAHRESIYKLIAMESFVWYLEALRNERIDRIKLREEVNKIGAEYSAAIRAQKPGDKAAALAERDIGESKKPVSASASTSAPPRQGTPTSPGRPSNVPPAPKPPAPPPAAKKPAPRPPAPAPPKKK